jgi:hypothetical protein
LATFRAILAAFAAIPEILKALERIGDRLGEAMLARENAAYRKGFIDGDKYAHGTGDTSKLEEAWRFGRELPSDGSKQLPESG